MIVDLYTAANHLGLEARASVRFVNDDRTISYSAMKDGLKAMNDM